MSVGKDVDEVGHNIVQQALIMRDNQHGTAAVPQRVDTVGHDFERVDVQTGIGFVKNRKSGLRIDICSVSSLFFSPPEKPTFTGRLIISLSMPSALPSSRTI